jgi:hypothetical protein
MMTVSGFPPFWSVCVEALLLRPGAIPDGCSTQGRFAVFLLSVLAMVWSRAMGA